MLFLIVDDEPINLRILEGILKKHGECILAEDGNQAIESFEKSLKSNQRIACIFLDIMMPNCSGQQALIKIRNIETEHQITPDKQTIIFMVTALNDMENQFDALSGGAQGYVVKPIDRAKIEAALKEFGLMEA